MRVTVAELLRSKVPVTDAKFKKIYNNLSVHELDLLIPCPHKGCLVKAGEECKGLKEEGVEGIVHIGRRIKRLMSLPQRIS